jgi:plastocyanin
MRFRTVRRPLIAVALATAVALTAVIGAGSAGAVATVSGSVGPGFTISLERNGKKVKTLRPTTYKFRIKDKSDIHNFHLKGPGVNRRITSVDFTGTKSVSIKLRKGTYRYVCDPHSSDMKGSFKVN